MPNYSAYPVKVRVVVEALSSVLESAFSSLSEGSLDVYEWKSLVESELAKHITAAFMSGRKRTKLTKAELAQINQWVQAQLSYLDRFAAELELWPDGEEYPPKFKRRALQYASSVVNPFYSGETWGIPLPAMPGDGTSQCGQNDKCTWEIVALEGEGNWDAYWELHPAEHCQTCIERARLWNPLQIRNYRLLLPDEQMAKEFSEMIRRVYRD